MHMGSIAKSIRNNRKSRCKCSTISVPKPTCTRSVSAGVPSSLRGPLEEPLVRGLCFRKGHCTSFCASVYDSSPPCTPSPWCCCLFPLAPAILLGYSIEPSIYPGSLPEPSSQSLPLFTTVHVPGSAVVSFVVFVPVSGPAITVLVCVPLTTKSRNHDETGSSKS